MTFPCNEVSSRTAGPLFKSCRVASPFLGLSPRSWSPSKPEFNYPYDLPFYRELPMRITSRNRRRTRTFFSSIPPSRVLPIQVPAPWKIWNRTEKLKTAGQLTLRQRTASGYATPDKPRLADFRTARHAVGAVARRRAGLGPRARRPIIPRDFGRSG